MKIDFDSRRRKCWKVLGIENFFVSNNTDIWMICVQPDWDFYAFSTTFVSRVFYDRKSLYVSGFRHVTSFCAVLNTKMVPMELITGHKRYNISGTIHRLLNRQKHGIMPKF